MGNARAAKIRKYVGGGLGNMSDSGIPKAEVEIYLRSRNGETFYVPSLADGLLHLLSNDGYRLGLYYYPDGAGIGMEAWSVIVYRNGNQLSCKVRAPMVDSETAEVGELKWALDRKPLPAAQRGQVTFRSLEEVLGLAVTDAVPEGLMDEVEVTIDGS